MQAELSIVKNQRNSLDTYDENLSATQLTLRILATIKHQDYITQYIMCYVTIFLSLYTCMTESLFLCSTRN